jgi:hypothetical protein
VGWHSLFGAFGALAHHSIDFCIDDCAADRGEIESDSPVLVMLVRDGECDKGFQIVPVFRLQTDSSSSKYTPQHLLNLFIWGEF